MEIPKALTDSRSPNNALVSALVAPSAPPAKFPNEAKSAPNLATSVDKSKAAFG